MGTATYEPLLEAVLRGDRQSTFQIVDQHERDGMGLRGIYSLIFQPALWEIGRRWEANEIGVAHERLATSLIQTAMSQLYGRAFVAPSPGSPVIVAACAEGEQHEIGLRMVADLMEQEGWDSHFLGANLPVDAVGRIVAEKLPDALALSATLTINVSKIAGMVAAAREAAPNIVVAVGGHPFAEKPELIAAVGADLSTQNGGDLGSALRAALDERSQATSGPAGRDS